MIQLTEASAHSKDSRWRRAFSGWLAWQDNGESSSQSCRMWHKCASLCPLAVGNSWLAIGVLASGHDVFPRARNWQDRDQNQEQDQDQDQDQEQNQDRRQYMIFVSFLNWFNPTGRDRRRSPARRCPSLPWTAVPSGTTGPLQCEKRSPVLEGPSVMAQRV